MTTPVAVAVETRPVEVKAPTLFHYGFTRADLPTITQTVQLWHAAGESSPGKLSQGTFARLLMVENEHALRNLGWELFKAGIKVTLIFEPDPPCNGALTAIGVEPILQGTSKYKAIREITRRLERLDQPENGF